MWQHNGQTFPIRKYSLCIKPVSVFPRLTFSFGSLNHSVLSHPLLSCVNRAIHLALVPLCHLAKDFKASYVIKAILDLVLCDDDNSIHK